MFKQEFEELKREDKKKIINRLTKMDEFKRVKNVEKLFLKTQKIEEFRLIIVFIIEKLKK